MKEVAKAIEGAMKRPADMSARFGGEEFALVLPESSSKGAMRLSEGLRLKLRGHSWNLLLNKPLLIKQKIITIADIMPRRGGTGRRGRPLD